MGYTKLDTSAYYAARSSDALDAQISARVWDVQNAVKNEEFYGRAPGSSWALKNAADQLEMLMAEKERRVPVREYVWTDDFSWMRTLTCRNHPTARYLTKNPFARSLHIVKFPEGDIPRSASGECTCAFSELVVLVGE